MKKILLPAIVFCFSAKLIAQSPINNNVYLWYNISSADTTAATHTKYFGARITSSFTIADYEKILHLSAQRVWNHTSAGDSLCNLNYVNGISSFFTPERSISSVRNLKSPAFNYDATQIGPIWPGDFQSADYDRFHLKNEIAVTSNLSLGKNLQFITGYDSTIIPNIQRGGKPIHKVIPRYIDPAHMEIGFIEKWNFDPINGKFEKDVNTIGYLTLVSDPATGEHIGYSPKLFLENPNGTYNPSTDVLLKKNVVCDESVKMWETQMLEDTSMHFSVPDAIELLQYGNSTIPSYERIKFLSSLFYYGFQHPSRVYPVKNNVVDSLHAFKSANEISNLFTQWDSTMQVEDPENPGTFVKSVLETRTLLGNIYAIRFYEDWYYDPKEMTIKKKVNGIGFILMTKTEDKTLFTDSGIYIKVN